MIFNETVDDMIRYLNYELKIQMVSVGKDATKISQEMYPKFLSELYKAEPCEPPNISLYWIDSNDSLTLRAIIKQADFTYIIASSNDNEAVQTVSEATLCEKDSFSITAWLRSNDNHIEMPKLHTPCIEVTPQTVCIPLWDICASRYIISFIGIDWEDISNAFKNYYDFSFVEIKGRKNAEEMIFDKDIASIFQTMNVYNNLQNVNVIMYMKETCSLEILSTIFEMYSLLPNHIYVLQNIWLVDDNEQADDMVIRIYCGEHNGKN